MTTAIRAGQGRPLNGKADSVSVAHGKITIEVVKVGPGLAAKWLAKQEGNRRLRRRKVDRIANLIAEGRWFVGVGAIVFDASGVMIDGQHRLNGIIQSGQVVEIVVVRGVDPDAKFWLDTGANRTGSDALEMAGVEGDTAATSTALSNLLKYERSKGAGINTLWRPENEDLRDGYERYPDIEQSVDATKGARTSALWGSHGTYAFLHYLFNRQDPEAAAEFFRAVIDGIGIDEAVDPRHLLRSRLLAEATRQNKVSQDYVIALAFKAWNLYREGEGRTFLRVRKRGTAQEGLPDIGPIPGITTESEDE